MGQFIRSQRKLAQLSLRELAEKTNISNPYLSQIERGLHEPSVRVIRSIANALNMSAESLLAQAGILEGDEVIDEDEAQDVKQSTRVAIESDPKLSPSQKTALLTIYDGFLQENKN
ncbi:MAG: helix-turn-helix transcriptional regulator [Acidimicrobiaceae bacterium]|nr:helix-turn-helix transcriptional regulator [Acidimicrobiaceae bacterium]